MDMREIQRLHAQFAPDSMVIDLPRQIAALPAPGDFSKDSASGAPTRWMKAGPLARGTVIAIAVAAVVGMAGMGAASVYTMWRVEHQQSPAATAQKLPNDVKSTASAASVPLYREINAAPAQPVRGAPALSSGDFASPASMGLTADQFRDSIRTPPHAAAATAPAAMNGEAERAAASPIHRPGSGRQQPVVAPQTAPGPQAGVTTGPAANTPPPEAPKASPASVAPAHPAPAATPPAPVSTAPTAESGKPSAPVRRHISRPRVDSRGEPDTGAKPATPARSGSAELQMF